MRLSRPVLTATGIILLVTGVVALEGGIPIWVLAADGEHLLAQRFVLIQLKQVGVFAVGWGTGVLGWLVTGDKALIYLFVRVPKAWSLWRKGFFTSTLPVWKYFFGGVLLTVLGIILSRHVWGIWIGAFDTGMLAGVVVGTIHSLSRIREVGDRMSFLEANQRHLNDDRISVFSQHDQS